MEELRERYELFTKTLWSCVLKETLDEIEVISAEQVHKGETNLFDRVPSRIKSFDSAVKKFKKKNPDKELTFDNLVSCTHDIIGVRIIVNSLKEVYAMKQSLGERNGFFIVEVSDYIYEPKASGYRSLHLDVMKEINFCGANKKVPVEIQVRTRAMQLWSEIDHMLRYKPNFGLVEPSQEIIDFLLKMSEILWEFDNKIIEFVDSYLIAAKAMEKVSELTENLTKNPPE